MMTSFVSKELTKHSGHVRIFLFLSECVLLVVLSVSYENPHYLVIRRSMIFCRLELFVVYGSSSVGIEPRNLIFFIFLNIFIFIIFLFIFDIFFFDLFIFFYILNFFNILIFFYILIFLYIFFNCRRH